MSQLWHLSVPVWKAALESFDLQFSKLNSLLLDVFIEFADQMENLGKDGIWELSVLATCGWIRRIYPVFLEFIEKNGKSG